MIHSSSSADPSTGRVHYVAQSFQPILRLNSISPPSLPIPLFSLSPQHKSLLHLPGCCQPPKSPGVDSHRAQSSTGSAMGIMLPTRGPRSMPQGCSLPTGSNKHPGVGSGEALTLRPGAPGSPFSPALPGSPWKKEGRAMRWRAWVGVGVWPGGRLGCGATA